jgi:hypothetical protein
MAGKETQPDYMRPLQMPAYLRPLATVIKVRIAGHWNAQINLGSAAPASVNKRSIKDRAKRAIGLLLSTFPLSRRCQLLESRTFLLEELGSLLVAGAFAGVGVIFPSAVTVSGRYRPGISRVILISGYERRRGNNQDASNS